MELIGVSIDEIKMGDKAAIQKTVTEADVILFAGVSTDQNPAHINEEYAKGTFFKKRIAHGALTSSFVSAVLGMKLPGAGTIYINFQNLWLRCTSVIPLPPLSKPRKSTRKKTAWFLELIVRTRKERS